MTRLNNRGVDVSRIERLVDENIDLRRVDGLLQNRYRGWSEHGTGLSENYQRHVVENGEWGGSISQRQYNQRGRELLNDPDSYEVYYQPWRDRDNLVVYNRAGNELAVGNIEGRINTVFQPRPNYISDHVDRGHLIQLK